MIRSDDAKGEDNTSNKMHGYKSVAGEIFDYLPLE